MKVVYLNVEGRGLPTVIDDEDELEVFYKLIGCRCIDIVPLKIGHKYYDVICDDEGLFKDDAIISAVDTQFRKMLVGNLIISKSDEEGELIDLSCEDIKQILRHTKSYFTLSDKVYPVLQMTY